MGTCSEPTQTPSTRSTRPFRAGADPNEGAQGSLAEPLPVLPSGLLQEVANEALQATHATGVAIAFQQGLEFTCQSVAGVATPGIGSKPNAASGLTGACVNTGSPQWCHNTELDSRVDADACRLLGVRAIVIVPLLHRDRLLGIIEVFSRRPYAFGKPHLQILQDLAERITSNVKFANERPAISDNTTGNSNDLQNPQDGKRSLVSRFRAFFLS
jgi:GAF domain-containing protein